ncbi:MAG: DUF4038 domain-containing protein [Frankia sp.]|nr:DUF4038 domain-containing protein [Frankia sp.]
MEGLDGGVRRIPCFLADTWWFALTARLSDERFRELAQLRARQGFTAVQLVVGIPPEVGPANVNAHSRVGPAWFPDGRFHEPYLELAREKIEYLNDRGLTVIIYGLWGHQLAWLGVPAARAWWERIVARFDDLDVIYCLTGESNLWLGTEHALLPGRTTDDLLSAVARSRLPGRLRSALRPVRARYARYRHAGSAAARRRGFAEILTALRAATDRPVLAHVVPGETSEDALDRADLLAAVTVQTGHDAASRPLLWEWPLRSAKRWPGKPFVNLEPWYEGIRDSFGVEDQLFAYWASMLAGAAAHCYGAHGVWNVGDGRFLAHWGRQTLDEAVALPTPGLLGASHRAFLDNDGPNLAVTTVDEVGGVLRSISRRRADGTAAITYLPDTARARGIAALHDPAARGNRRFFDPGRGEFVPRPAPNGPLVVIEDQMMPDSDHARPPRRPAAVPVPAQPAPSARSAS